MNHRRVSVAAAFLLTLFTVPGYTQAYTKPNVRAITAFVRLDPATVDRQIADALTVLRAAEGDFARRGYRTETLRIVTQPLGELVHGRSDHDALLLLKAIDDLSAKEGFIPSVGPAMMRDSDDPHVMRLLERALSTLPNLQGSSIIAAEDGIHWNVIRESAALVRYLTDHSPQSQANFSFTASAMLKPYGPFYPGAYHTGAGRQFSIGFEAANVVQEVFAHTRGGVDGLDFHGRGPHTGPARRRIHRRGNRDLHRGKIRIQRDHDGGAHHYYCGQSCSCQADWILWFDGSGHGR
jgi:uncharacterized protein